MLPKGLHKLRKEDGTELKTLVNSSRLKIYYQPVELQPKRNTSAEKPLKSGANKKDENTLAKPTKSVKVNLLERDRDTIPSKRRLNDNIIKESQKLLKKQFPNIGSWQDTLLCQTSFSAVTDESVLIHHTGKITGFAQH